MKENNATNNMEFDDKVYRRNEIMKTAEMATAEIVTTKKVKISYGAMLEKIETQLNKQGYTLGEYSTDYEEYKQSIFHLWMNEIITDEEINNIILRLHDNILEIITLLSEE